MARTAAQQKRTRTPKVAILVESSNAYARGLLSGIEDYIRRHGPWMIYLAEQSRGEAPPRWISDWDCDGIIARVENPAIAAALKTVKRPIVNLSYRRLIPGLQTVTTDNDAIGQMAVQHFTERGFRHFAYCGRSEFVWSIARGEAFAKQVRAAGYQCAIFPDAASGDADRDAETDRIGSWLHALPRPLAVFTCYDWCGQQVLEACRRAGFAVPEEIAVLGVDNDELVCSLLPPPLSSVMPNARHSGWLAADMLACLMRGEKIPSAVQFIPPIGIATRQSTDTLAVEDPQVARALRFIRERACEGIGVDDILRDTPMARRSLEQRMVAIIGRTPHDEILRVKLARAKQLLATTDLTLVEIADRCGFRHPEYLSVAFKREVGVPPSNYRRAQGR